MNCRGSLANARNRKWFHIGGGAQRSVQGEERKETLILLPHLFKTFTKRQLYVRHRVLRMGQWAHWEGRKEGRESGEGESGGDREEGGGGKEIKGKTDCSPASRELMVLSGSRTLNTQTRK